MSRCCPEPFFIMHAKCFPCIQMDQVHQCSQLQVSCEGKNGRTCCIMLMMGSIVNTPAQPGHLNTYCSLLLLSLFLSKCLK
ncbi:unnamed protein product [Staurois parvus]|uniref:Uncharacterized protein n=1 Tax=Staurois parvus TaxID=386267 RepID=A0ABN9GX65_9NEOB|nr:unnamed protein product [Staurois parvus]